MTNSIINRNNIIRTIAIVNFIATVIVNHETAREWADIEDAADNWFFPSDGYAPGLSADGVDWNDPDVMEAYNEYRRATTDKIDQSSFDEIEDDLPF